ncbi:cytochrome P450 monooxygenase [Aspergillus brunneoviolaceus CBS 621.78]|uniref:Cytochrome P450 monooxygenase n=1 Tax=Aspergillus brunneoviolaceus CBS 621.78 TaxID=1450534 RepID=A0ACD1FVT2_9EURO|nr:cytochrome P450 monooxygenase [Aspergillus brunneoviolaceus CBS 621.78]RAH41120.1 cytochrome P450 monooxygenase [Aspergillus brunneoviolaceus CBS 621.78]
MLSLLLLSIVMVASVWLCRRIWYERFHRYRQFPQLPTSLLWGHLKIYHEIAQWGFQDGDHDHIFAQIHETLGRPPVFLFDYRPICRPVLVIASHEVAEQISRPSQQFRFSVPKLGLGFLEPVIGHTSILAAEGEEWKALRRTFSPWFSPQNLQALVPTVVAQTRGFVAQLDALAGSGDPIPLVTLTTNLMYDIIGAALLDEDLDAQHLDPRRQSPLVRAFNHLIHAYWDDQIHLPWFFNPVNALRRRRRGARVQRLLQSLVRRKHAELQAQTQQTQQDKPPAPRSITALALHPTMQDPLTPALLTQTSDQLRTFLLGGHDSPSATLAWALYELSRTPRAQAALHAELDTLFGEDTRADPTAVQAALASPTTGPSLLRRMVYLDAVLKETLRLHPPASTARYAPGEGGRGGRGEGLTVRLPAGASSTNPTPPESKTLGIDDLILYNCPAIIHRDPAVFGPDAHVFRPERWLGDHDHDHGNNNNNSTTTTNAIPPSAWRPYERGPRACIGQEFARLVMRVALAVVGRRYAFSKVGLGAVVREAATGRPVLRPDGQAEVEGVVYTTRQITARPVDGLMMTVREMGW